MTEASAPEPCGSETESFVLYKHGANNADKDCSTGGMVQTVQPSDHSPADGQAVSRARSRTGIFSSVNLSVTRSRICSKDMA